MAYIVMALWPHYSYGLYKWTKALSDLKYRYGLCSYGLRSYGLRSYGLRSYGLIIVMA